MPPAADHTEAMALDRDWYVARCTPDAYPTPPTIEDLDWVPARVPGTVAGALRRAGAWRPGEPLDTDAWDWWFLTTFATEPLAPGERATLCLDGVASVSEVFLNGERLVEHPSMFTAIRLDVGSRLQDVNTLAVRCRALDPLLQVRRRPRARWRTRIARDGNLRWIRTTLHGRAPGFSPGPAPVGPWRPVRLVRTWGLSLEQLTLRPRLEGGDGVMAVRAVLRVPPTLTVDEVTADLNGPSGAHKATLKPVAPSLPGDDSRLVVVGTVRVPEVHRWWPHTHGDPVLHRVNLRVMAGGKTVNLPSSTVGFREIAPGACRAQDPLTDGLDLHVNGVRVFARGAVWTGADPVGLAPTDDELRRSLEQVRDAGMNLLRVPGTGVYESSRFHALCDELGIMVWQDLALANFDYPVADAAFAATLTREIDELLERIGGRPSTVVVCGGSEVEQQVAMLGLDPALARGPLFDDLVPTQLRAADVDAFYVPSSPCGGDPPMRTDVGIAHYYGVGGYRRPLSDVRQSDVRFAAECLAFANVPEPQALAALLPESPGELTVHHPRWKAGVPRDVGAGWDFDDVRDHYLQERYDLDPVALRSCDHERYLELSRTVSGEVMAAVFGEWRRAASRCGGGLVLWWRDVVPGAGWGLTDHTGQAKVALHHLARALAPVAVWTTDEGLNGVALHVANDGGRPLRARLRVALYRDGEHPVAHGSELLQLPPHTTVERRVEALVGRFVDSAWAYRFGPSAHDLIVATLEDDGPEGIAPTVRSQAFAFPAGRSVVRHDPGALGIAATLTVAAGGTPAVAITARRFVDGVRLAIDGWTPSDDAFSLEPGGRRIVTLRPQDRDASWPIGGTLRALNLQGSVRIAGVPAPTATPVLPV